MSCNITSGIVIGCKDSVAGLETIYIADLPTYDGIDTNIDDQITGLTQGGSAVAITFYEFQIPKQTSGLSETINTSVENGTTWYQQDVTMVFNKLQSSTRDQIKLLAQNPKLLVVVKDNNGIYWVAGLAKGCELTAGTSNTGVAYGDRSGYELTISGFEPEPIREAAAAFVA